MSRLNEKIRYAIREEAAIEDFDDGSLVFLCRKRHLIQINETAKHILNLLNGSRNLKEIIEIISNQYAIPEKIARHDILELIEKLGSAEVLKPIVKLRFLERQAMKDTSHYLANPDVSLREEEGDGAILFSVDSNALLIINPIGLIIWKFIAGRPRTKSDIIAHIKDICDDVPVEQVETDVEEFLKDLMDKRFIGEASDE